MVSIFRNGDQEQRSQQFLANWRTISMVTYVKLFDSGSELAVEQKLPELLLNHEAFNKFGITLQPLQQAHLSSAGILFDGNNRNKGDAQKILLLSTVAIFLLLIAAFNFMNLSTARSTLRAKEVGIRKVSGATKYQLVRQFIQESYLLVIAATVIGLLLIKLLEPFVSFPIDGSFLSYLFTHPDTLWVALTVLLFLGLVSGSYPAFVLSSFTPIAVLKSNFSNTAQGLWIRRTLVVIQFTVSIVIIIGIFIVNDQLDYMKNKDMGFERDGIINIRLGDQILQDNYEAFNDALMAIPEVLSVASSFNMPGNTFGRGGITPLGVEAEDRWIVSVLTVDGRYFDTLKMRINQGRSFSSQNTSDLEESVILNQSAANAIGWSDPIGEQIRLGEDNRTVVGVVEDFHFTNMRHKIEPVIIFNQEGAMGILSVRIEGQFTREALEKIESAWSEINPNHPFEYTFLTEQFDRMFSDDEEFSSMLYQFTFVAIIIACLGLYGLASFTADQKTKEIGIRKVLGATGQSIIQLVMKEYVLLIIVANLIAWPVTWYFMNNWLSGFVYRTDIAMGNFLLATAITTAIALVTVSKEIITIVRANPVMALRYE